MSIFVIVTLLIILTIMNNTNIDRLKKEKKLPIIFKMTKLCKVLISYNLSYDPIIEDNQQYSHIK